MSAATYAGLCEQCRHVRVIENRRGSRFLLCERSRYDPAFARYPRLPVLQCPGFDARDEAQSRPMA